MINVVLLKLTTEQELVQSLQPTDGYKLMLIQTGSLNCGS